MTAKEFESLVAEVAEEWCQQAPAPQDGFVGHLKIVTALGFSHGREWCPILRLLTHRHRHGIDRTLENRVQRLPNGRPLLLRGACVIPEGSRRFEIENRTAVLFGGKIPTFDGIDPRSDEAAKILDRFCESLNRYR